MRLLVTGAGGFVGGHLVEQLLASGHEVAGSVLQEGESVPDGATRTVLDIEDADAVRRAVRELRPEAIVHLAGLSDVAASWKSPDRYFQANVLGTENLLRAAPPSCRVVFASSAEVYGKVRPEDLPLREDAPAAPSTPYALTKAAAERLALEAGAVVVRSFNLVGPGQSPRFALPAFAAQLAAMARGEQEPVLLVGNLEARRDFVHVVDGAAGYETLAVSPAAEGIYNMASGEATRVRDALDLLLAVSGLEVRIEPHPEFMRPSDVPEMCGDAARLEALGWCRRRSLEDAVADLWRSLVGARSVQKTSSVP